MYVHVVRTAVYTERIYVHSVYSGLESPPSASYLNRRSYTADDWSAPTSITLAGAVAGPWPDSQRTIPGRGSPICAPHTSRLSTQQRGSYHDILRRWKKNTRQTQQVNLLCLTTDRLGLFDNSTVAISYSIIYTLTICDSIHNSCSKICSDHTA